MFFEIVYPERRTVSGAQIETWFSDAVANGDVDPALVPAASVYDMAKALDDAGIITLGRTIQ